MTWLALDIGGANIKVADGKEFAVSSVFPLWKKPKQLADALRTLIAGAPRADHLAATMSGELADCFATKVEGVQAIVQAFVAASDGRHARVYLNNGTLVAPQIALKQPLLAAAANWHALAHFAGRYASTRTGLAIDIGTTTCDIVPLVEGKPAASATTDSERLLASELVYTGVERSPVCALVNSLPWRKQQCPTAHELFSTTWDAYLTLGDLPEEPQSTHTADGQPATKDAARDRLARTICADRETFSESDALAAAEAIARSQLAKIAVAVGQVLGRLPAAPAAIVISGRGEFVARRALERMKVAAKIISLNEELGPALSRCAPAHALAVLARETYASEG
jgi:(4-(4-[2-(gamma-L-glutamylamino)ethyl]phenoxymethyl)furan-2-yl)methanamine synthase